jgi:hypothetical protein
VKGRILTGANADDSYTFLDLTHPIWSKSPNDPRVPSSSEGANSNKLHGLCVWPLSIPIPKVVGIPSSQGDAPQIFQLPETFLERHSGASVQYDLTIRISRGKLRSDSQYVMVPFPRLLPAYFSFQNPNAIWLRSEYTTKRSILTPSTSISGQFSASRT